jgi:hypothetical protein
MKEDSYQFVLEASEIKITADQSIFATLKDYFLDTTKHNDYLFIRRKKGTDIKWVGAFIPKAGRLNYEQGTYNVTPITYDNYYLL